MKFALTLLVLLSSATSFAGNSIPSYKAAISRGGKTETKVIYNFWSGEYPGPVIDVNAKVSGSTLVTGYKSIRNLSGKTSCEIKNGVYHPWSETDVSAIDYYSIIALEEYVTTKDVVVETDGKALKIEAGSTVTEFVYYGEGWVGYLVQKGSKRTAVASFDPSFGDVDGFKRVTPKKEDAYAGFEQWIYVKCNDGQKIFVSPKTLLKTQGVQQGTITGYGSVGPKGADMVDQELSM